MAKKAKGKVRGVPKPELHPLDKTIYVLTIIFSIFLSFVFVWMVRINATEVAAIDLSNPNVIAYFSGNEKLAVNFLCFWLLLPLWAGIGIWKRIPLFKPLLNERKHSTTIYAKRKSKRLRICVDVLMVIVCAITVPFVLSKDYSRWVLEKDGTVTEYSAKNELVNTFKLDPNHAEKVNFAVSSGYRGRKTLNIMVEFEDGKKFEMNKGNFINVDMALEFMEDLKAGLNDNASLKIEGKTRIMKDFIRQNHIPDSQTDRWYALFEMSS